MSTGDDGDVLQHTPLHALHQALDAKLVGFGGWEMPISYRGILDEHRAVRTAAGIFDVSHMGEIEVRGPQAAAVCQRLTTNDVGRLADGHVQYTMLLQEDGGVVDDVTLYRVNAERFFFCVNASNIAKDLAWIAAHAGGATVVDRSAATALIALQGPAAARILATLTPLDLARLRSFRFARSTVAELPALVSRSGYTGEDGFELYVDAPRAVALWQAIVAAGSSEGLQPIGLGARDTLRLEAALALYGNELDDQTSPLAAGLARFVKLDGDDFIGRAALLHEQEQGTPRRLVGLEMRGPGIARHGYMVLHDGETVGVVTSGTHAPTLGHAIALAYVATALTEPGTELAVDVRGRPVPAVVVAIPFYRRAARLPAAAVAPEPFELPAVEDTAESAETPLSDVESGDEPVPSETAVAVEAAAAANDAAAKANEAAAKASEAAAKASEAAAKTSEAAAEPIEAAPAAAGAAPASSTLTAEPAADPSPAPPTEAREEGES